jgi:hypothetical protein
LRFLILFIVGRQALEKLQHKRGKHSTTSKSNKISGIKKVLICYRFACPNNDEKSWFSLFKAV